MTVEQEKDEQQLPDIALTPVESSQIGAVGYDAASSTLRVQFKRWDGSVGNTYRYANVSPDDYKAFVEAESLGKHFGATIKADAKKFPYTREE